MKITLLTNIVSPHQLPLAEAVIKLAGDIDINMLVSRFVKELER